MVKSVDSSDETIERLADGDRLETVARLLRDALANALRIIAWPSPARRGSGRNSPPRHGWRPRAWQQRRCSIPGG
jgi:hypothetical protein